MDERVGGGWEELRAVSVEAQSSATHNPNVPDSQSSEKLHKTGGSRALCSLWIQGDVVQQKLGRILKTKNNEVY